MKNAKQHLFYTFLTVFVATATVTLLGVTNRIEIRDAYLKPLMVANLLGISAAVVAMFRAVFAAKGAEKGIIEPPLADSTPSHPSNRVPMIAGKWRSYPGDGNSAAVVPDGTATIDQTGSKIIMRLRLTRSSSGEKVDRIYLYRGELDHSHLVLTWYQEGGAGFNSGAVVMHLSSNLDKLAGKAVYFHHSVGHVVAEDFFLCRM